MGLLDQLTDGHAVPLLLGVAATLYFSFKFG